MRYQRPQAPRPHAGHTILRLLGVAALLGVGIDHLAELTVGHYSSIPTIGTLFALNFASAAVVALALLAPWRRLGERAGRIAPPLLALAGIGIAAGSLAGLLISESSGLFGFTEDGYRGAIMLAIGLDAATLVLLGADLATIRPSRRAAAPSRRVTRTQAQAERAQ
jgi:hypothetical protein